MIVVGCGPHREHHIRTASVSEPDPGPEVPSLTLAERKPPVIPVPYGPTRSRSRYGVEARQLDVGLAIREIGDPDQRRMSSAPMKDVTR